MPADAVESVVTVTPPGPPRPQTLGQGEAEVAEGPRLVEPVELDMS